MKQTIRITFLVFGFFIQSLVNAEWNDITTQVDVNKTPQAFDRVNRTIFSLISVHNRSGDIIPGPLRIRIFNPSIPFKQTTGSDNDTLFIEIPKGLETNESNTIRIDFQLLKSQLEYSVAIEQENRPETSEFSLFFGGSGNDEINATEVDRDGNIIIAGNTTSSNIGPVMHYFTNHPVDDENTPDSQGDAFIAKLTGDGHILWVTYIGGNGEDNILDIKVDDTGSIYAAGATYSNNFPTTDNALQHSNLSGRAAFVFVLNSNGDQLIYSTLVTGSYWNYGFAIDVDRAGDIYVAGFTHGGFPTTAHAAQPTFGGFGDGFLAKLRPNEISTELLFSTYLGGSSWEGIDAITLDDMGDIYIATHTQSTDFPTTPGAYDETCTHCSTNRKTDGVIAKLSADGSQLLYSTIIGTDSNTGSLRFTGIAVSEDHSVFATGTTNYSGLMTTDNALQRTYGGGENDIYLVHLNSEANNLLFATYLGGNGNDRKGFYNNIKRDTSGRIYFSGATSSSDFPLSNPIQSRNGGQSDAFAVVYDPTEKQIVLSTYLGGNQEECDNSEVDIGIDTRSEGVFYLVGSTKSSNFPVLHSDISSTYQGGDTDGFVTKIDINEPHCMGSNCLLDNASGEQECLDNICTIHVATSGSDVTGDGTEFHPFSTIQYAINQARNGETILVHDGRYYENINFIGKAITVGSLFQLDGNPEHIANTIIDGGATDSVVRFENCEDVSSKLIGLSLTNGYAHGDSYVEQGGGGIRVINASPLLENLHIYNNEAQSHGAGIYFDGRSCSHNELIVEHTIIENNHALAEGGGVSFRSDTEGSARINRSVIRGNHSNNAGGGIFLYHTGTIENSIVVGNVSNVGGGFYIDWGTFSQYQNVHVINNTIVGNSAQAYGGGISYVIQGGEFANSIVWGNVPDNLRRNPDWWDDGIVFNNSLISPLRPGTGNVDTDPLFVSNPDPGNDAAWGTADDDYGDLRLQADSPMIDQGDASSTTLSTDYLGKDRIYGDSVDIGAIEFHSK
jgi:hypothetical protein